MSGGKIPISTFSLRERQVLVAAGLAGFAFVYITTYTPWDMAKGFFVGTPIARDFINFWLGGHLALTGELDTLIDRKGYTLLIERLFGHTADDPLVFSYPPSSLLFFVPFALLPFTLSAWIWTGLNLFCVYRSVLLLKHDHALGLLRVSRLPPCSWRPMVTLGDFFDSWASTSSRGVMIVRPWLVRAWRQ